MNSPDALDELVGGARDASPTSCAPTTIDSDEAADLVERCAELAARLGAELDARARGAAEVGGPGAAPLSAACEAAAYPVELQEQVDALPRGAALRREPGTERLEEAMRYSLLAGGKRIRPVLALATAEALGRRPAEVLPLAAAHRDDPHLLADPRRPAGDGRRRPAPRQAHLPRGLRRGRGDPRRRRALRRGARGSCSTEQQGDPAQRARRAARGRDAPPASRGMVGGQYLDVAGRRPRRRRPAPPARAEDRRADRRVGRLASWRSRASTDLPQSRTGGSQRSWASSSRSSTTSST